MKIRFWNWISVVVAILMITNPLLMQPRPAKAQTGGNTIFVPLILKCWPKPSGGCPKPPPPPPPTYPKPPGPAPMTSGAAVFWPKAPYQTGTSALSVEAQDLSIEQLQTGLPADGETFLAPPIPPGNDAESLPLQAQGNAEVPLPNQTMEGNGGDCPGWIGWGGARCTFGKAYIPAGGGITYLVQGHQRGWSQTQFFAYVDLDLAGSGSGQITVYTYGNGQYCRQTWIDDPSFDSWAEVHNLPCRSHAGAGSVWFALENRGNHPIEVTTAWAKEWDNPSTLPTYAGTIWGSGYAPGDNRGCFRSGSGQAFVDCVSRLGIAIGGQNNPGPNGNYVTVGGNNPGANGQIGVQCSNCVVWFVGEALAITTAGVVMIIYIDGHQVEVPIEQLFGSPANMQSGVRKGPCVIVDQSEFCGWTMLVAANAAQTYYGLWLYDNAWATVYNRVDPLAPRIQDNWFFAMDHTESSGIAGALTQLCQGVCRTTGDGRSNGSIEIYASVPKDGIITVALVYISGSVVNFVVFKITDWRIGPSNGYTRLGQTEYYYNKNSVVWWCAWAMSRTIGNGQQPVKLTVGQGLARWATIRAENGYTIPLAEFPVPF